MSEAHPKDICTCGHLRALHRNGDGACKHRHVDKRCEAFELERAHIVLSAAAMTALKDLVEVMEPITHMKAAVVEELHEHGFLRYDHRTVDWVGLTPDGLAYAKDNGGG